MIELLNLQVQQADQVSLDIPALTVAPGEVAAIVGPAGSGGEALSRLLTGRLRPTAGAIHVGGQSPVDFPLAFSHKVGVVFQEDTLARNRSVAGNLKFQARLRRIHSHRVQQVLALVDLADLADAPVESLTPGQVRRLSLAVALLHEPVVLIVHEPFARSEPDSIPIITRALKSYAAEGHGVLVLAVTDNHLAALCDVIYLLDHGRIADRHSPKAGGEDEALAVQIALKTAGGETRLRPADFFYAVREDAHSRIHTLGDPFLAEDTVDELERPLSCFGFFRAHPDYLVNLQHVTEINPLSDGTYCLRLADREGTLIPLSRKGAQKIRRLIA